jgi:signal transduction histidine kinase
MKHRARFPIRIKFMLTLSLVVTAVVTAITFATANLFQEDKKVYVKGLTSMVALGTAEDARFLLGTYRERLSLYGRLMLDRDTPAATQEELSRVLFEEFPELVSVTIDDGSGDPLRVHAGSQLDAAGLSAAELLRYEEEHPVPVERVERREPWVRNTTLVEALPAFTMAVPLELDATTAPVVVRAVLRSERLLDLTSRYSAYEQFLVDSEGRYLSHSDRARVVRDEPAELDESAGALRSEFQAGVTSEFERDGKSVIGSLADAEFGGVVVAAEIPGSAARLASQRLTGRLLVVAGLMLALSIGLGVLWAHGITRPVEALFGATRTIAQGDFDVKVDVRSRDEIGVLASSFNHMTGELKTREEKLRAAHAQLVQSEKMAAFGQLGAGIAHEVKNPLTGILACAQLAAEEVPAESAVHEDLKLIEKEAKRCKGIIENLMKFARQEKAEMGPTDVNAAIEDALAIVRHQMELNEVKVELDLSREVPQIAGNANQLQQVFLNFMINAQQAMEGAPGRIRVSSRRREDGTVELAFADSGPGIPLEIQSKLFEPFFSTKPVGKGTGLGLSVSYGIIQEHGGQIRIDSEPGKGATFVVTLPAAATLAAPALHAEPAEVAVPV